MYIALRSEIYPIALQLIESETRTLSFTQLTELGAGIEHFFEAFVNCAYAFALPTPGPLSTLFSYEGQGGSSCNPYQVDDYALITLCSPDEGFKKGNLWLLQNARPLEMSKWRGIAVENGRVVAIDWPHSGLRGEINPRPSQAI